MYLRRRYGLTFLNMTFFPIERLGGVYLSVGLYIYSKNVYLVQTLYGEC